MTRKLSEDERKLWNKVRENVAPIHSSREEMAPADAPGAAKRSMRPERPEISEARHPEGSIAGQDRVQGFRENFRIPEFRIGEKIAGDIGERDSSPSEPLAGNFRQSANKDRKLRRDLKRGNISPEDSIDLHGLTVERARPALTRFIGRCHANGMRLVLVITGKGRDRGQEGPIPERAGVLRRQAPVWLSDPGLKHAVREVQEALPQHGGGGAFYVWLRRRR